MSFQKIKISDFCLVTDYVANGSFKSLKNNVEYLNDNGYAILVRFTDFTKNWNNNYKFVSKKSYDFLKHSKLHPGDLIMSNVGEPGRVFLLPDLGKPMTLGPNSILIRPDKTKASPFYMKYYFETQFGQNQILQITSGAAQKKFNKTSFRSLFINLPPLPIQQKIVEKLYAIFSEIDKATAAAEANVKNTEALFQSFLNVKMENKDKRWTTRTFDEMVFEKQVGLVKNSNEQVDDGKYSYFKMNNITNDNKCNLKSLIKVNATDEEFRKYKLKKNDFLFNTRNSVELVGKACIFDGEEDDDILYNNNIMRVRFRPYVNPYFILYAFSNKKVRKSIEKIKTGATNVAAIYYKDLKDLTIHIPDLETQNKIVSQTQKKSSFINVLSKKLKNKISNLTSLKQSILKKAFAGELIKAA